MLPRPRLRTFSIRLPRNAIPRPPRRTLVAAPKSGSGPLMERRSDRDLPTVSSALGRGWIKTIPIFIIILGVSTFAIFNYQNVNSSVVTSTLYALRTNERAREVLGENIYFRDLIPWIWGDINQLHGRIDIEFAVKGSKSRGMMKFKSSRKQRMGYFETEEWSLKLEDGTTLELLRPEVKDPFQAEQEESRRAVGATV